MSSKGKSTAQRKIEIAAAIKDWAEEKVKEGTLYQYVFRGQLNRSEIAAELGYEIVHHRMELYVRKKSDS